MEPINTIKPKLNKKQYPAPPKKNPSDVLWDSWAWSAPSAGQGGPRWVPPQPAPFCLQLYPHVVASFLGVIFQLTTQILWITVSHLPGLLVVKIITIMINICCSTLLCPLCIITKQARGWIKSLAAPSGFERTQGHHGLHTGHEPHARTTSKYGAQPTELYLRGRSLVNLAQSGSHLGSLGGGAARSQAQEERSLCFAEC